MNITQTARRRPVDKGIIHLRSIACSLAVVSIAMASPAIAADQFDLKCVGERQLTLRDTPKSHSYGIRIDLNAGKWCWDRCDIIYDIQSVQPDRLVLAREDVKSASQSRMFVNEVSRVTGRHEMESIETRPLPSYFKLSGQCEPSKFSGFPATKF